MRNFTEPGSLPIHRVQVHQHADQRFGHCAVEGRIRRPIHRELLVEDQPLPPFHHVKGSANHCRIFTQDVRLGCQSE